MHWNENPSLVEQEMRPASGRPCALVLRVGAHPGSTSCGALGKLLNHLSFLICKMGVLIPTLKACCEDEMSRYVCGTQNGIQHTVSP